MKSNRILISLYSGYMIYSLLTFVNGSYGLVSMNKVEAYERILTGSIEDQMRINEELSRELHSLRSDTEVIRLRSRELGYFSQDEYIIRVRGYSVEDKGFETGSVKKFTILETDHSSQFRAAGLCAALLVYLLSFLIVGNESDDRRRIVNGVFRSERP